MFQRITFTTYNAGSAGLQSLRQNLTTPSLRARFRSGRAYARNDRRLLVNWGSGAFTEESYGTNTVLNKGEDVADQSNKISFFRFAGTRGLPIPSWTRSNSQARAWLDESDRPVVARTTATGHSGEGIVLVHPGMSLPSQAVLYTKYIPKKSEFRVHFFRGKVIDIQKKGHVRGNTPTDWQIRTHRNGFVYIREGFGEVPTTVTDAAEAYMQVTPLDFGALDIIWTEATNTATILEVNTAPGLVGTTARRYAEALDGFCNES